MTESPPVTSSAPSWLDRIFRQTRTRILLLYVVLMLIFTGLSVPVFQLLIAQQVGDRVREDLKEEREKFELIYEDEWSVQTDQTIEGLQAFADKFLEDHRLEDDNFAIFIIDDNIYRQGPSGLPSSVTTTKELYQQWLGVTEFKRGEWPTTDPDIGNVIWKVEPLFVNDELRGSFVLLHMTAGEQDEAFVSIFIFAQIALGVVLISFILAWVGTGKLLQPVGELATTARSISETDLSQRLLVPGKGQLADLATAFNAMMDRVQGAFDSQRQFINDAGHELRTPITIIRGHLELMGDDPQEQQETVELVLDELDRMGRLVNDMIALAKSQRPDFLRLETINLVPFTQDLFTKAQALARRQWRLALPLAGTLICDRQQLSGALLNLLRNATQHTQATDMVELGCRQTPTTVEFWVKDTGTGIAPEDQQRIFERFSRAGGQRAEGSGLGLAIVQAITEAHQGQIYLASQPGLGSTFTVQIPRQS